MAIGIAPDPTQAKVFYGLIISGGQILLPLALITIAFSKAVQRHSFLTSFIVSWIIYSTSLSLRVYAGQHLSAEYTKVLCIIQACLVYASFILVSCTNLSMAIYVWALIAGRRSLIEPGKWMKVLCVVLPYVVFLAVIIASAVYGALFPQRVEPSPMVFYCTMRQPMNMIATALTSIIVFSSLIFLGMAVYIAVRNWAEWCRTRGEGMVSLELRVFAFICGGAVAFSIAIGKMADAPVGVGRVVSFFPLWAFLCFGTRMDIMRMWLPWNWFGMRQINREHRKQFQELGGEETKQEISADERV